MSFHFTQRQFLEWAETQPPEREYAYMDGKNCALSQFLRARGADLDWVGGVYWHDNAEAEHRIPAILANSLVVGQTFGGLAETMRKRLKRSEKKVPVHQ